MCSGMFDSLGTPRTAALQAPLSMEFSRQEHWSGLALPPPGAPPGPGIQLLFLAYATLAGRFFTTHATKREGTYVYLTADSHCKAETNITL